MRIQSMVRSSDKDNGFNQTLFINNRLVCMLIMSLKEINMHYCIKKIGNNFFENVMLQYYIKTRESKKYKHTFL